MGKTHGTLLNLSFSKSHGGDIKINQQDALRDAAPEAHQARFDLLKIKAKEAIANKR